MAGFDVHLSTAQRLLVAACLLFLALVWRWSRRGPRYDLDRIPQPKAHPIFGHLLYCADRAQHKHFVKWAQEIGPIFKIRLLGIEIVQVSGPDIVSGVLSRGPHELPKAAKKYQNFDPMWGNKGLHSMFTLPSNAEWKLVRKAVAPAFSPSNCKKAFDIVRHKTYRLVEVLSIKGPEADMNMDEAFMRLTLDTIGLVGFKQDLRAVEMKENRFFHVLEPSRAECQARIVNRSLHRLMYFTQRSRHARACLREWHAITSEIVREVRRQAPFPEDDMSVAACLLRVRDPVTGQPLSDDAIQAELSLMLVAGFDTTGHTLAFVMFCIATHPEVETKLLAELASLGLTASEEGKPARQLQHEDLAQLRYMQCVIQEAMRLFPVGRGTMRKTQEVTKVGPYTVPPNTYVSIGFMSMHYNPAYWPDPEAFKPERWESDNGWYSPPAAKPSPGATGEGKPDPPPQQYRKFLPFSDGPRGCVGQALAMLEIQTVTAIIMSRLSFRLTEEMGGWDGVRAREINALTMHVDGGIHMHCTPRAGHLTQHPETT